MIRDSPARDAMRPRSASVAPDEAISDWPAPMLGRPDTRHDYRPEAATDRRDDPPRCGPDRGTGVHAAPEPGGSRGRSSGVIGDEDKLQAEPLQAIDGRRKSVIPDHEAVQACEPRVSHRAVGLRDQKHSRWGRPPAHDRRSGARLRARTAWLRSPRQSSDAGANMLRGGAFKPRTSPYSFQGMGEDGLKILQGHRRTVRDACRYRGDGPPSSLIWSSSIPT